MDDIRPGMEVLDRRGEAVGRVKEVIDGEVVIDRRLRRDASVGLDHVTVLEGRIGLDLDDADLDLRGLAAARLVAEDGPDRR